MHDRIQELISDFLYHGTTPEQETELFDLCSKYPASAELLRRHLLLSLKLRKLREGTEIKPELRNETLRRINLLQAQREQSDTSSTTIVPSSPRRLGFAHLFGAVAATAVIAVFITLAFRGYHAPTPSTAAVAPIIDTFVVVLKDTVTQLQPVYIVRTERTREVPESPVSITDDAGPEGIAAQARSTTEAIGQGQGRDDEVHTESMAIAQLPLQERTRHFLEQYNAMLTSVESVQLTSNDRISD